MCGDTCKVYRNKFLFERQTAMKELVTDEFLNASWDTATGQAMVLF